MNEDIHFKAVYKEIPYEVTIRGSIRTFFMDNYETIRKNEDHTLIQNILNFIVNAGFKDIKSLSRLGRRP